MTFTFDEQYAMFDITPVDNQFILEYLPGANGDYVKVYLYGLLSCYHPGKNATVESMSRDLELPEEVILAAFRYWERHRIVRRVSDRPPEWQFVNIKQVTINKEEDPEEDYAEFSKILQNSIEEKDFRGNEVAECYEWKEEIGLPTEVIILLLKYMVRTRGKNFKMKDVGKLAILLKDENAVTLEDAEQVLFRDEAMTAGFRSVLRKLGMRFNPSEANIKLYRKWTEEWLFTPEAVLEACDRTGTSKPSLALVDSILEQTYKSRTDKGGRIERTELLAYEEQRDNLKEILNILGQYGPVTPLHRQQYLRMLEMYPHPVILLAARECAAKQKQFDSVIKLIESWKERGFTGEDQIREHITAFYEKEKFLKTLKDKWADKDERIGGKTIQMLDKWEISLGFSREMITLAADLSFEARKPVSYMDKILSYWAEHGIRTPEDAEKDRTDHREQYLAFEKKTAAKPGGANQYSQRDYTNEQEDAMRRMISSMNGGDSHA